MNDDNKYGQSPEDTVHDAMLREADDTASGIHTLYAAFAKHAIGAAWSSSAGMEQRAFETAMRGYIAIYQAQTVADAIYEGLDALADHARVPQASVQEPFKLLPAENNSNFGGG